MTSSPGDRRASVPPGDDAAQERGEIASRGGERSGREHSAPAPTAEELGLTHRQIHEARQNRPSTSSGHTVSDDPPEPEDHCKLCGAELPCDDWYGRRLFCSRRCRLRWHYLSRPQDYRGWHGERTCPMCGTRFEAAERTQRYCSKPCGDRSRRVSREHLRAMSAARVRRWRARMKGSRG
jgi:predicted nucleic acid-binding Zn ribbon protein